MFKLIRRLITLAFLLVVGAVVLVIYSDNVAEKAIEAGGTFALGAETTVAKTDVSVIFGSFEMEKFEVKNPTGFSSTPFLSVDKAAFDVGWGTLLKNPVTIERIAIEGSTVNVERKDGKYNYESITDKLKRFQSDKKNEADGKRFIVDELVITRTRIVPQGFGVASVDVPEVKLTGIGRKDNKGVTMGELTALIVESILRGGAGNMAKIPGLGDLVGDLNSRLGQIQGISDMGVKVMDGLGVDLGSTIGGALGDLLGGKK